MGNGYRESVFPENSLTFEAPFQDIVNSYRDGFLGKEEALWMLYSCAEDIYRIYDAILYTEKNEARRKEDPNSLFRLLEKQENFVVGVTDKYKEACAEVEAARPSYPN